MADNEGGTDKLTQLLHNNRQFLCLALLMRNFRDHKRTANDWMVASQLRPALHAYSTNLKDTGSRSVGWLVVALYVKYNNRRERIVRVCAQSRDGIPIS